MTTDDNSKAKARQPGIDQYVPRLVYAIVILVALAIPARIISYGYVPEDDALRHAAKAVSDKPWSEIVVFGNTYTVDHNFGWHFLLRQIHLWTGCDAGGLVDFSVLVLFALLGCCALPWLKRPEAWLGALLLVIVGWPGSASRFMIGRPFLLTTSVLLTILFLWRLRCSSPPKWRTTALFTVLISVAVLVHGVWYLWALPVAAFFLAREFRWGIALGVGWVAGTFLGAAITGHPLDYIFEALQMAVRAIGMHPTQHTLVSEFQPASSNILAILLVSGLLVMRQLARLDARPLTANPVFWLACLCWMFGFANRRFWDDWGLPSLLMLLACDLDLLLQSKLAANSSRRLALAGGLALASYVTTTSDIGSRWTHCLTSKYLSQDDPELAGWLPDKGGVFYAADPSFFYETFFKNPKAEWRYILGFEMTLMPEEDFATLYRIKWNAGAAAAYKPWVDKMHPEDRLFVRAEGSSQPPIPGLEWHYTLGGMWSGRLPRTNVPPAISSESGRTQTPAPPK